MQREDDRDRAIDRALRQSIAPSERESRAEHVDGETLAAWAEGQLRPDASVRIEQHVNDCARCQQLLATFARTAPPPTITEPLWRRWHLQWLVPIATAATVAAIWVAMPRTEQSPALATFADRKTPAAAEPAAPPAAAPPPPEEASTRKESLSRARTESQPGNQAPKSLAKSAALSPNAKREEFERRDAQDQLAARQAAAAAQVQSPPAIGQAATREKESDRPPALQETITVAPPRPPAATPSAAADATAPAPARRGAAGAPLLAARAFTGPPEIRSPNAAMRWRILDGGRQIERTTNGGAQWEAATLSSAGVLVTGVSPSPTVCWIVGRGGAVYVTTDGLRFLRLMFPESIDLVSVTATDDRHATVMSADGRSFRTDDQGATWTRP